MYDVPAIDDPDAPAPLVAPAAPLAAVAPLLGVAPVAPAPLPAVAPLPDDDPVDLIAFVRTNDPPLAPTEPAVPTAPVALPFCRQPVTVIEPACELL
jgi:hypothetical protein